MNDESSNAPEASEEAPPESEETGPRAGERLRDARREQQISVLEVAKELHLDENKVRALERNEFDRLGAPVFAKGHLRKYAELVSVDEADVMDDYYTLTRATDPPPVVVSGKRPPREFSPGPIIAILILFAFVIFAYWWFVLRTPGDEPAPQAETPTAPESQAVIDQPTETASEIAAEESPAAEIEESVADEVAESPVDTAPEPAPEPVRETVLDDGTVALELTFSGDCWTEISDADGRRLYFGMGRAGATANLSGVAPISVLFGNADNVAMRVDGNSYRLPEPSTASRSVRLTIVDSSSS